MIYLISQEWLNTRDNHCGMKYLAQKLELLYPSTYTSVNIENLYDMYVKSSNKYISKLQKIFSYWKMRQLYKRTAQILSSNMKDDDVVFFLEYLERDIPQDVAMRVLKKKNSQVKRWIMIHLVPHEIERQWSHIEVQDKLSEVDKVFTLGESLSDYLQSYVKDKNVVFTSFHYVDEYYFNSPRTAKNSLEVLAIGNQMRNIELLRKLVKNNPNIHFTICQGVCDFSLLFDDCKNVKLIPFVKESQLKEIMINADVSLNVMKDTIGSNVIVTSLAMSLAMIVSDVGSIRNYCDSSCALFCNNDVSDFTKKLEILDKDRDLLNRLKEGASKKAQNFRIEKFHKQIIGQI